VGFQNSQPKTSFAGLQLSRPTSVFLHSLWSIFIYALRNKRLSWYLWNTIQWTFFLREFYFATRKFFNFIDCFKLFHFTGEAERAMGNPFYFLIYEICMRQYCYREEKYHLKISTDLHFLSSLEYKEKGGFCMPSVRPSVCMYVRIRPSLAPERFDVF
jgi:hypothetical protein